MGTTFHACLLTFALLAFAPTVIAAEPSCAVPADPTAVPILDDHYLRETSEGLTRYLQLWRESNGLPGLQPFSHRCMAGDSWRADDLRASIPLTGTGSLDG